MPTSTHVLPPRRAQLLLGAIDLALKNRLNIAPDVLRYRAKPGALLVEPVNGNPWVFVAPNNVHVFEATPGSGTDKLRQQTYATVFFDQLKEQA